MQTPQFIIYIGPMYGSKTTRLLADIDKFSYKSKKIFAFKPKRDNRYSENEIVSHMGAKFPAFQIEDANEIYNFISNENKRIDIIAVDEAFMINNIDIVLIDLFKKGYTIIVSSIQLSGENKPFENIKNILPWGTKIEICTAVCTKCDDDAFYTKALFDMNTANDSIKIGTKESYSPMCHKHCINQNQSDDLI